MAAYALIELEGMHFFGHHGCFEEERRVGGDYVVHLAMRVDCAEAMASDRIEDALNYQQAYELIDEQMRISSHLLEHLAGRMLVALFEAFPALVWAQIKVQKINPPMGGKVASSAVTLERTR